MEAAELQKEYDSVTKEIKALNKKKTAILDRAKKNGFAVFNGKIKEDTKTYGVFYDTSYYSHFDGHMSEAIYHDESGAHEISEETFNKVKDIVMRFQETCEDEGGKLYKELIALDDLQLTDDIWGAHNFLVHFIDVESDDEIIWSYSGDEDQGELCDDSHFTIRKTTKSVIKNTKTVDSRWD